MPQSPASPALLAPLANRPGALADVALLLSLVNDLHPERAEGQNGRLYSKEAEEGKSHLIGEAARIVGAIARAEGGKAPNWQDDKPLHWPNERAADKVAEARRVLLWIGEHFTHARAPLDLLSEEGARGLGLLVRIAADMLEEPEGQGGAAGQA